MSYFISQESDQGFRVEPDDLIKKLRAAWPDSVVRSITDPKRKYLYEWTLPTKTGSLEGSLERLLVGVVLDGDLASAATFAVWFQRNIAGADKGLMFYDENYDPVVSLKNNTTEAEVVDVMSKRR